VTPADLVAPRFSLTRRALRLSRTNVILARVACDAAETEPCAGTVRLASTKRVVGGKRVLQLGRGAFSIRPGSSANVKIKVSKRNARIARRLRRFKVKATAVARDVAGNERTVRRALTLVIARTRR
jgi:hypothetical protein